ncbi:MAG: hypothetical protein LUF00_04940 [Lachnospiraceae bacterium]|nr:hypothetical protein [Lachnospiraceae bacterium]
MREKMRQFMSGRYGADQLGRFLMGAAVVTLIIYMISRVSLFYLLALACLIWYYYRAMSRNCSKRYEENLRYLQIQNRVMGRFRLMKTHLQQRKTYRFYKCPSCKQKVRVPKGRGKISITCPKCHAEFIRKS